MRAAIIDADHDGFVVVEIGDLDLGAEGQLPVGGGQGVLIEGFTDTDGSYLYNLNLSLRRSEWVMCTLIGDKNSQKLGLSSEQKMQIKKLFLAGGVAFNNSKDTKDASRRVELRLQFYGLKEREDLNPSLDAKFSESSEEVCRIV